MNTKFQDKMIVDNLELPNHISIDIVRTEQFKRFAAFILKHKSEALTSREVRMDNSNFSPILKIENTVELNVFTNEELKDFVREQKLNWIKGLNDYLHLHISKNA